MYHLVSPDCLTPIASVQDYCRLPYPGHPEGCPNWGSDRPVKGFSQDLAHRVIRQCPPAPLEDRILDYTRPLFIIYSSYPVGLDADERMHDPDTSLSTLKEFYNLRYWQGRARSAHYRDIESFLIETGENTIADLCPEAHGVRLTIAMWRGLGIKLRFDGWPPAQHDIALIKYQVSLGGYPAKRQDQ